MKAGVTFVIPRTDPAPPHRRNVMIEDVGAELYLMIDLARGVTGEIHHVDTGYDVLGRH